MSSEGQSCIIPHRSEEKKKSPSRRSKYSMILEGNQFELTFDGVCVVNCGGSCRSIRDGLELAIMKTDVSRAALFPRPPSLVKAKESC